MYKHTNNFHTSRLYIIIPLLPVLPALPTTYYLPINISQYIGVERCSKHYQCNKR